MSIPTTRAGHGQTRPIAQRCADAAVRRWLGGAGLRVCVSPAVAAGRAAAAALAVRLARRRVVRSGAGAGGAGACVLGCLARRRRHSSGVDDDEGERRRHCGLLHDYCHSPAAPAGAHPRPRRRRKLRRMGLSVALAEPSSEAPTRGQVHSRRWQQVERSRRRARSRVSLATTPAAGVEGHILGRACGSAPAADHRLSSPARWARMCARGE